MNEAISPNARPQREALIASIPILFSFVPLGFGFGYIAAQLTIPWHLIIFMAAIIYAGSAEFSIATMLAKGYAFSDIFIAAAFVNLRHIFYGLSVSHHYPKDNFLRRFYMIHALTDETYSLLAAKCVGDPSFAFYLSLFNHCYWVLGVALGASFGYYFAVKLKGLEFCLTALFVVLAIEQFFHIRRWFPFLFAFIAAIFAKIIFPNQMLMMSMLLVTLLLAFTAKWERVA